jgi:hypothetical protein
MNIVSIDDLEALRPRMDQALADLDRGDVVDGEDFMLPMLDELDLQEAKRRTG